MLESLGLGLQQEPITPKQQQSTPKQQQSTGTPLKQSTPQGKGTSNGQSTPIQLSPTKMTPTQLSPKEAIIQRQQQRQTEQQEEEFQRAVREGVLNNKQTTLQTPVKSISFEH